MYKIIIKANKEKQLVKHHPWVFTGAIESVSPPFETAGLAKVYTSEGKFIAYGHYDERSHIVLHLLSWEESVIPDTSWLINAIKNAVVSRKRFFNNEKTNCFRLIHGEADFIPGLAVDIYGSEVRIILSSRYANDNLETIITTLASTLCPSYITVTVDPFYAGAECLKESVLVYNGRGERTEAPAGNMRFWESGLCFEAERGGGQKSGFYCDQRDNRNIVESYSAGKRVLDACCYTGAFTLHALRGGATSVTALDASESALRHLLYQVHLNENEKTIAEGSRDKVETVTANVFEAMRSLQANKYDLMILDPPKLARTKGKLEAALKAYKDLNRMAMIKIKDGGIIATFSCSGSLSADGFREVVAWAAADALCEIQILRKLTAGEDHPVRISFPESEYLTGLLIRVIKN